MKTLKQLLPATMWLLAAAWLAAPGPAHAKWSVSPNSAPVIFPNTADDCYFTDAIQLGSGNHLLAYNVSDYGPGPTLIFINLQLLTPEGNKLWGEEGIRLCPENDSIHGGAYMTSDSAGGAILIWWDSRNVGIVGEIYGQRVNAAGEFLWNPAGVYLVTVPESQQSCNVADPCSDGEGGAYLAFAPGGGGMGLNIYAQRINSQGQTLWPQAGAVCTDPEQQSYPLVSLRTGGGCYIAWDDYRTWPSDVYAQRLAPDGTPLWQTNGINLDLARGDRPHLISDTRGGFLYQNNPLVTRVGSEGQILWSKPVENIGGFYRYAMDLELSPTGRLYVPIQDRRQGYDQDDVYGQCLDLNGNYLWDSTGVLLAHQPSVQGPTSLELRGNGFITPYANLQNGLDSYYQVVDSLGHTLFNVHDGAPLFYGDYGLWPGLSDGQGGLIAFWQAYPWQDFLLAANRVTQDGYLGFGPYTQPDPVKCLDDNPSAGDTTDSERRLTVAPNPANPRTMIRLKLLEPQEITLSLYNTLGGKIATVAAGLYPAGEHRFPWDFSALPSGTYLVKLVTPAGQYTAKITALK
jgi:hypothetical protein